MNKTILTAAIFSLTLLPLAAGADIPPPETPKVHTAQITPQSQGQANGEVTVGAGDTLLVRLPAQGGTAYTWVFDESTAGPELEFGGSSTEAKTGRVLGGGQIKAFQFTAAQAGSKELVFAYMRANDVPTQTYVLTVTVSE